MNNRKLICQNDLIDMSKKYKAIELKIFYNMLYCYKEQKEYKEQSVEDTEIVYMDLVKLENYLGNKHLTENELIKIIQTIPKGIYSKDKTTYVSVFNFITYNTEYNEIRFKICEEFKPLLDDVVKEFTVLELKELSEINSVYSQRLFEFVSKNKNINNYLMPINEFKEYFNIPASYNMCNIDQRVINPMLKEINNKTRFNITIIKEKNKNKVTHIRFKFKEG